QNTCIKRIIESSNISLYELEKIIINSIEGIQKEKKYEEHIREILLKVNILTVFPEIKTLVTSHSNIEEIKCIPTNNPPENEDFKSEPDSVLMYTQFLLQQLDQRKINEIWNISRLTERNMNHISRKYHNNAIEEPDFYEQQFIDESSADNETYKRIYVLWRSME
ncbi:5175_t:CDS:2, partial [Racocetra persica]